jgi:hypothetical protein
MHMANAYGANQIWIVNVGDIKPMEFPINFFLDYAWSPQKWNANNLQQYTKGWAAQQFGPEYAADIADIIAKYTKYNGRRKPELLDENTYNLINYREFETVVEDYKALEKRAQLIYDKLPADYRDAYFELVLHPVKACANLNEMYFAVAKNHWYAQQGRAATNDMAAQATYLFKNDAAISQYYNKGVANGKWNHMMDQTHIGYTYWQQPTVDKMPEIKTIELPAAAQMGVAVEGAAAWWPNEKQAAKLAVFTTAKPQYIELFNRGSGSFKYKTEVPGYVNVWPANGTVEKQTRLNVAINWDKAPLGLKHVTFKIIGEDGTNVNIEVTTQKSNMPQTGFSDAGGYIAIEAPHYTKALNTSSIRWVVLPDNGRTSSAVSSLPVTAPVQKLTATSAHLEYKVNLSYTGEVKLDTYVSPSLDFNSTGGLKFAVSIDDEAPQIMNLQQINNQKAWEKHVAESINILSSVHNIAKPGLHTIKYWVISPGVVLQKLVLDCGGVKPSYLGPPETDEL